MKLILRYGILLFMLLSVVVNAQTADSNKIPAVVGAGFLRAFPKVHNIKWGIGGGDGIIMYDVNIYDDTLKDASAVFDIKGDIQEVDISERVFNDTISTYNNVVMQKARRFMYRRYRGCVFSCELEYGTGYKFEHCIIRAKDKEGRTAHAFFNAKGKVEHSQRLMHRYIVVE